MQPKIELFKVEDRIWDTVTQSFNTTKERIDEDVTVLQKWLNTQPHLPKMLDFQSVRNFFLLSKCSIEVAKHRIDNYYSLRTRIEEVFDGMNPKYPYITELKDIVYCVPYPQLTEEMYRIFYFKFKNEELMNIYNPLSAIKKLFTIQELRLREDVMFGDIFVVDCKGITLAQVLKVTPTRIYDWFIRLYGKIFSLRLKAIYILNMPTVATTILTMAKSIIKPKIFERIHVCKDVEEIRERIPLKFLPKDFGGEGLSLDELEEALEAKYKEKCDLFDSLEKMEVDESLRPEALENGKMDVYGNFKKLNID